MMRIWLWSQLRDVMGKAAGRSNAPVTNIQAPAKHSKPWLANFVASMRHCDRETELYGIIALARNMLLLCEAEKITGDPFNERLCRAVLYRIRKFADFSLLQESHHGDLKVVKDAQRRLEGMVGTVAWEPLPFKRQWLI